MGNKGTIVCIFRQLAWSDPGLDSFDHTKKGPHPLGMWPGDALFSGSTPRTARGFLYFLLFDGFGRTGHAAG